MSTIFENYGDDSPLLGNTVSHAPYPSTADKWFDKRQFQHIHYSNNNLIEQLLVA